MTDTMEAKKEEIGYAWNFVADLGNGRQFALSGNFPKGMDASKMNEEVDKVRSVFDRQQAKSALRGAEEEIEVCAMRLANAIEDLDRIDNKHEQKGGLSAAERQAREQAVAHVDKLQKDLEYKQSILKKLKEESK